MQPNAIAAFFTHPMAGGHPYPGVPEKVPEKVKVWEALAQSQVRFNRVPEKVPVQQVSGEGSGEGSIGAKPGQVQQGSEEGSGEGSGRL